MPSTKANITASFASTPSANNPIINGGFDIWQRGTSATTGGYSAADRWRYDNVGGTYTISKQTFTPGTAPVSGYESTNFARVVISGQTNTGGDLAIWNHFHLT